MRAATKRRTDQSVCAWCGGSIPYTETARTFATPPHHQPLPQGCAWVICGKDCKALPTGTPVHFARIRFETAHDRKGRR